MTPAEHAIAVQALIDQLAAVVSETSRTTPRTVILSALLSMYRTTALHSPCCTEVAANACLSVGTELAISYAINSRPAGAPVH